MGGEWFSVSAGWDHCVDAAGISICVPGLYSILVYLSNPLQLSCTDSFWTCSSWFFSNFTLWRPVLYSTCRTRYWIIYTVAKSDRLPREWSDWDWVKKTLQPNRKVTLRAFEEQYWYLIETILAVVLQDFIMKLMKHTFQPFWKQKDLKKSSRYEHEEAE